MKEKEVITILRKWDNPEILVKINVEEISLSINFSDFMSILKAELANVVFINDFVEKLKSTIGSVTFTFKEETFNKKLDSTVSVIREECNASSRDKIDVIVRNILEEIKKESKKVVM